jgi:LmbE family N-acetylglucosaminyl deacetylase
VVELSRATPRLDGAGTPESDWQGCPQLRNLPPWNIPTPPTGRGVIVAPHPDDEILGVGGTWSVLCTAGVEMVLVAVTDGENSHPRQAAELRQRRPLESTAAAGCLGVAAAPTLRLGHPDGDIAESRLRDQLAHILRSGDLVLAPWDQDGHPDHDRVGRAARAVADQRRAQLLSYLVWAWHWASPDGHDLPWDQAVRVELGRHLARRKRRAVRCFTTQLTGPNPILSPAIIERLTRSYEVLLGQ